jgi:hypothetical protein
MLIPRGVPKGTQITAELPIKVKKQKMSGKCYPCVVSLDFSPREESLVIGIE